jgi:uncharacterized protein YdaU (DUF1376 family)
MRKPAFQFYPADYLSSARVCMMTLEEEGAYMRLLCYCWIQGHLPADPEKLSRLIGKGGSTTLATVVAAMFKKDPGNAERLIHDRLEEERVKQAEWAKKSSLGGKASAAARNQPKGGSTTLQPNEQGWLPNGANQKPTLQSSSSSLSSELPETVSNTLGQTDRSAKAAPASKRAQTDDEWLAKLSADPAYAGIDVQMQHHKMRNWCDVNRKEPTRRRFVNWLNRCDKPLGGKIATAPASARLTTDISDEEFYANREF